MIPGKAPFLLSIQALRAMKARLDCEHDVLEIPGIGKVPLEVNSVGHYLLPLLNFSNRSDLTAAADHGFVSAEADFGPESELVVDDSITRPGSGLGSPPGLELPNEAGHESQNDANSPDRRSRPTDLIPNFNAVASRTEGYAIGAFLRLARETKGPWVALPRELATVYLILGKHAYDSKRIPWKVKAAQVGYRSRIIRRGPLQLKHGWVLVMSLADRRLEVVQDWTRLEETVGRSLPKVSDNTAKFLFAFALPPDHESMPGSQFDHDLVKSGLQGARLQGTCI